MKFADPRKIALDVLLRVEAGAFSDLALDSALAAVPQLEPRDRGLTTELVYGILRQLGRLDFALSRCCRQPLAKLESKVLWLLRLGAYQILCLDRVPDRAAVHTTVELARRENLERATGFLNGILRALGRQRDEIPWPDAATDPAGHLEYALSLPSWLARRWLAELGTEEAIALAGALLSPAPFTLRVNTLKISRPDYLQALQQAGHEGVPTGYAPEGVVLTARGTNPLPGGAEGWYQVQDEASMLIAHLLGPQAGEEILDACAAPGGKTTHIAALSGNRARLLALDLHPQRVALIAEGARRLGAEQIEQRPWDLTTPPDFLPPESFDRVLLDAPCSGLGVLRRNPEIRWRRRAADLPQLAELQRTLLGNVAPLVRPGGTLLYSVCTSTPEETTGVVGAFLTAHPEFTLHDLRHSVPASWHPLFDEHGRLRTFPHRHGGMDAFFAVRLDKQKA
ncbi:MAG: 16S rRNA (cytosine(967)-C(5))-methyltransferase RsmB [Desulfuromonadales bacterium]|nr:16S rRNA (cytosine(967)-C(5))-methyltransferase RsmB [Desulfuromonadales bacterium]